MDERLAVSMTASQYEWVESVANTRGVSMAHVVRDLIEDHRRGESGNDSPILRETTVDGRGESPGESIDRPTDPGVDSRRDQLEQRIEALEARLDDLEGIRSRSASVIGSQSTAPDHSAGEAVAAESVSVMAADHPTITSGELNVDMVLDGWTPSATIADHVELKRVGATALDHLRSVGRAGRRDLIEAIASTVDLAMNDDGEVWEAIVRPALERARELGVVEKRVGSADEYIWIGPA